MLLVLFGFSMIPAGLSADARSNLPACCRGDGKHGCSMKSMATGMDGPSGAAIRSDPKCPHFPKAGVAPGAAKAGGASLVRVAIAFVMKGIGRAESAEAQYRASFSRGRQKRGPPSLLS
ncbi:MAG: hypothetical protein IT158_04345 [Bryobacterales bacterium]|nr:hypothetical protein [Bryobacterales bacterium]